METKLMKDMEKELKTLIFATPKKENSPIFAKKVTTPIGIVDAILLEKVFVRGSYFCTLIDYFKLSNIVQRQLKLFTNNLGECKNKHLTYPNDKCESCFWRSYGHDTDFIVTCYSFKTSLCEFQFSNNNLCGNKNYYVVPNTLISQIEDLVPVGIGIISYDEVNNTCDIYRDCQIKNIGSDLKSRIIYHVFQKS
jgi:hypothetical protein